MSPKRDIVDRLEGRYVIFDDAGNPTPEVMKFSATTLELEAAREIRALRIALKSRLHDLVNRKPDNTVADGSHI